MRRGAFPESLEDAGRGIDAARLLPVPSRRRPAITCDWPPGYDWVERMEARLSTERAAIIGPEFAARCVLEEYRPDGAPVLRAYGPTALPVRHIEPRLRERIAVFVGYEAVKRFDVSL